MLPIKRISVNHLCRGWRRSFPLGAALLFLHIFSLGQSVISQHEPSAAQLTLTDQIQCSYLRIRNALSRGFLVVLLLFNSQSIQIWLVHAPLTFHAAKAG